MLANSVKVINLNRFFRGGVAVQLEHDAGFMWEANEGDSGFGLRHSETADERNDEVFHQVPVGEVDRRVGFIVDDATGRIQYEGDICPRVAASCDVSSNITEAS